MNYLLFCQLGFELMFFTAVENKQVFFTPEAGLGPEKNFEENFSSMVTPIRKFFVHGNANKSSVWQWNIAPCYLK